MNEGTAVAQRRPPELDHRYHNIVLQELAGDTPILVVDMPREFFEDVKDFRPTGAFFRYYMDSKLLVLVFVRDGFALRVGIGPVSLDVQEAILRHDRITLENVQDFASEDCSGMVIRRAAMGVI